MDIRRIFDRAKAAIGDLLEGDALRAKPCRLPSRPDLPVSLLTSTSFFFTSAMSALVLITSG